MDQNTTSLAHLRDPETALRVLSREDEHQLIALCVCCTRQQARTCPHQEPQKGKCSTYVLDERDPRATELRILAFLGVVVLDPVPS